MTNKTDTDNALGNIPNRQGIIFVGGIHGAGKSTFAHWLSKKTSLEHFSCSTLIEEAKNIQFSQEKVSGQIDSNQGDLVRAVHSLRRVKGDFILDGHFCLRNERGDITRLAPNIFQGIAPGNIILIEADAHDILARRPQMNMAPEEVQRFMDGEREHALYVGLTLGIPVYQAVSNDSGKTYAITQIPG